MRSKPANNPSCITRQSKLSKFLVFAWFLVVSIFTLPLAGITPSPGIDNSWLTGLNMALIRGMQFGKDIVFTFGPLGFLFMPSFCDVNQWVIAYLCGLLVHFVLVLLVFLLLPKITNSKLAFILGSALLLLILPFLRIEEKLIPIAFLLLTFAMTHQVSLKRSWLIAAMSLCLALASSIKFSATISSAGIIIAAALIFTYRRQFLNLGIMLLSYLLAYMGIWILTGQHIANLIPYLHNSIEISTGYNQAMMCSGPNRLVPNLIVVAGIAGISFFYLLFAYGFITRKLGLVVFMLPFLVFAFMTFKFGFVRHDSTHFYVFFSIMPFLFGWIYLAHKQDLPRLLRVLLLVLCCAMASFIFTQNLYILQNVKSNLAALKLLTHGSSYRQSLTEEYKLGLRKQYNLSSALVAGIGKDRIDIVPWEINLPYAYDMNWSPRPIFQSYTACTKALDLLNAGYYENSAPDMLLYTVETIDRRYAVFDEPATFREILKNYKPVSADSRVILLRKKVQPDSFRRRRISAIEANIGEGIQIPKTNGYLFANIRIENSLLGKAAAIAYRGEQMYVYLVTDKGQFVYRFVPSTAQNGIFLSSHISDNQDLLNVFNGRPGKAIRYLGFTTGKRWFYEDKIQIEFFEIQPN
ncbi:MAG: hypothetical protein NTW55_01270 [Planctomycetota bacterium]|nr:hypothetical protein [Planctomycetota bacterium]